jgi:hypothetical protein
MNDRGFSKHWFSQEAATHGRRRSLRKLAPYLRLFLGVGAVAIALLLFEFGGTVLARFGQWQAEHSFAEAYPGAVLHIGKLDYAVRANRLVAQSVTVTTADSTFQVDRLSVTGVHWVGLLSGTAALAEALAAASLDITSLEVEFPQAHYGIRCARLQASVPNSALVAERCELRALVGDEAFFAAHDFRATRFHVLVPACSVAGLAYADLLMGKSYHARSVRISRPSVDALVDRDKPVDPAATRPLMVHEAMAVIQPPMRIDSFSISDGHLTYREQVVAGADPGVLTFGAVSLSAAGITNRGDAATSILVRAQGTLMDAGTVNLMMSIPVKPPDFSLRYSGSLSAMDLTRLDAFLANAEHTRIKSGHAQGATFEIEVTGGEARGRVQATYENLEIAFLDKQTGSENGLDHRVASFLAKELKFRSSNGPDPPGSMKQGKVTYTKKPADEFLQFVWFALRSGALDAVSQ